MTITMDIVQTTGFALLITCIGNWIVRHVKWLRELAIPGAVVGGLLFAVLQTILRINGFIVFEFDTSLFSFFQTLFFTTVGYSASIKSIRSAGSYAAKMILLTIVMILIQNGVAVGLGTGLGLDKFESLLMGSSALMGGFGITGAVAPTIESMGYENAMTIGISAATFGVATGAIIGGPIARTLIKRHHVETPASDYLSEGEVKEGDEQTAQMEEALEGDDHVSSDKVTQAVILCLVTMFFGSYLTKGINWLLGHIIPGMSLSEYLGSALLAFIIRTVCDYSDKFDLPEEEINTVSDFSLDIFLSLALLSLKLWTIADIGGRMLLVLVAQLIVIILFALFICFPTFGNSYDSVILTTGFVGYAQGSSYNSVASMRSVIREYGPCSSSAVLVPLVCAIFSDFLNIFIIYFLIAFMV